MRFPYARHQVSSAAEIPSAARVVDAFGVELGTLMRVEPERFLLGSGPNEPALWLRREAIMRVDGGSLVLACARNRIGQYAIPAKPAPRREQIWPYGQAWPGSSSAGQ